MKNITMSRHGIYYFQYWIPKHLKSTTFNKSIFRFSLKTTIRQNAKKQVYEIMVIIYNLEERYRNNSDGFGFALLRLQQKIKKMSKSDDLNKQIDDEEDKIRFGASIFQQWKLASVNENDIYAMEDFLAQYSLQDIECFVAAKEYYESTSQPLQEKPKTSTIKPEANETSVEKKLNKILEATNPILSNEDNPTLKIIVKEWGDDVKGNYLAIRKYNENIRNVGLFIRFVGEKVRIKDLSLNDINGYKKFRRSLPKGTIAKKYTIVELKSLTGEPNSQRTLKSTFSQVACFLKWCVFDAEKSYPVKPQLYEHMKKFEKITTADIKDVEPFTDEDLMKLFNSVAYIQGGYPISLRKNKTGVFYTSAMYWVALIALFTGARQTEIIQLEKHDIYKDKEANIWIFHFKFIDYKTEDKDKHGKTEASDKKVPIHTQLIKLGLLDYIKAIKGSRLFPDESRDDDGEYSNFQSRWGTYRKKLGVEPSHKMEKKDFHTFRHTVRTRLSEISKSKKSFSGFDSGLIDSIVGHSGIARSIGDTTYTHTDYLEAKAKALGTLQYDFINFDDMIRWDKCTFWRDNLRAKHKKK